MYRVKGWHKFQHYKDRNPPWIKLHKNILDDYEFNNLPVASKALAPMLWLLASENKDPSSGVIDASDEKISFRLRMTIKELKVAIMPLINNNFIELYNDASTPIAERNQSATPERESYRLESEREKRKNIYNSDFEDFWKLYPRKDGSKSKASEAYMKAVREGVPPTTIAEGAGKYVVFISAEHKKGSNIAYAHAATWLHQKRWEAEYPVNGGTTPQSTRILKDESYEQYCNRLGLTPEYTETNHAKPS